MSSRTCSRIRLGWSQWARRVAAGGLMISILATASGCQFQTLRDYTPYNGTQTQLNGVTLRAMTIVLTGKDSGPLTGSLTAYEDDELIGIRGTAQNLDGTDGEPLQVTPPAKPVRLTRNAPTQLANSQILIRSAGLRAGGLAKMQFGFRNAGEVELLVTIYASDDPEYSAVPTPSPASPAETPTGSPTPTGPATPTSPAASSSAPAASSTPS